MGSAARHTSPPSVALLTGGSDKPYAVGLATALSTAGVALDFVGSDELDCPEVRALSNVRFLNLRGDQREDVPFGRKVGRILMYYLRLLHYAAWTPAPIIHILWNNKFEFFDRTVLMLYYRLAGKRVVLTAHNVNAAARNGHDNWVNRLTLRVQYRLCNHIFVHTEQMKDQLVGAFGVWPTRVTVIPFGINDTVPRTSLAPAAARQRLGVGDGERVLLFFGQIAPYKGLQYLIDAVAMLRDRGDRVRLVIAGKVKRGYEAYWQRLAGTISRLKLHDAVVQRIQFIPDSEVETFFKAADVAVLPYVSIFQSGVPFLAFSFGVPVIATDVGSLREDVTHETGILCVPEDAEALARAVQAFYSGPLHRNVDATRWRIRTITAERHSWDTVAQLTMAAYGGRGRAVEHASSTSQRTLPSSCQE